MCQISGFWFGFKSGSDEACSEVLPSPAGMFIAKAGKEIGASTILRNTFIGKYLHRYCV